MRKSYYSYHCQGEHGFTLVEILVAMIILLLIATACFPLFTMATKTTLENKARMTAAQIAKQELERTLAQVTAGNYTNEHTTDLGGAPLITGASAIYAPRKPDGTADPTLSSFQIQKIVNWVDDPADEVYPNDTLPFDYKELIIKVSCPSMFTGNVTQHADFKTFIAREGSGSPITGVIVEVVRGWTDEYGNRIPLEGATVNLAGNGNSYSAQTNADGQAMIPITFPDSTTVYSFQVLTEYSGMISRPDQLTVMVEARPNSTSYAQVEMETPATLTLRFAPSWEDVAITLDGHATMGISNKTLAANNSSVTFSNLWPAGNDPDPHSGRVCSGGTYDLKVEPLLAYRYDLSSAEMNPENFMLHQASSESEKNLWTFHIDYNGSPAWIASDTNYSSGTNLFPVGKHRLAYPAALDLTAFKPASANIQAALTASFVSADSEPAFYLSAYNSIDDGFPLVYTGKNDADLSRDEDWTPLIMMGTDSGARVLVNADATEILATENSNQLINPSAADLKAEYFMEKFQLRIDSDPNIGIFYFRNFDIRCSYSLGSFQFTEPGDNLNIQVSGN